MIKRANGPGLETLMPWSNYSSESSGEVPMYDRIWCTPYSSLRTWKFYRWSTRLKMESCYLNYGILNLEGNAYIMISFCDLLVNSRSNLNIPIPFPSMIFDLFVDLFLNALSRSASLMEAFLDRSNKDSPRLEPISKWVGARLSQRVPSKLLKLTKLVIVLHQLVYLVYTLGWGLVSSRNLQTCICWTSKLNYLANRTVAN